MKQSCFKFMGCIGECGSVMRPRLADKPNPHSGNQSRVGSFLPAGSQLPFTSLGAEEDALGIAGHSLRRFGNRRSQIIVGSYHLAQITGQRAGRHVSGSVGVPPAVARVPRGTRRRIPGVRFASGVRVYCAGRAIRRAGRPPYPMHAVPLHPPSVIIFPKEGITPTHARFSARPSPAASARLHRHSDALRRLRRTATCHRSPSPSRRCARP